MTFLVIILLSLVKMMKFLVIILLSLVTKVMKFLVIILLSLVKNNDDVFGHNSVVLS